MELTENLRIKVLEYKNSLEFLWNKDEQDQFRVWHLENGYGTFGVSPHCWNKAIKIAIEKYNI